MSKFQYNGEDERVFPTLGITVKEGDSFDAPDDFSAFEVSSATAKKSAAPAVDTTPSAPSDSTASEVK